jgi:hypothetical protein
VDRGGRRERNDEARKRNARLFLGSHSGMLA